MKILAYIAVIFLMFSAFVAQAGESKEKSTPSVLMVLTSYGLDDGKTQPGFEFDEFAKAYLVLSQSGLNVDVASPKGGEPVADKYDPNKAYNQLVLNDTVAMNKLANTKRLDSLMANQYQGVFVVGGKGAMFDLPTNTELSGFIGQLYENQGVVAAVCHGPAALVNVKLSNGEYLVANKAVNGFTNEEEKLFGKKWLTEFPFLLEDKLKAHGGSFQHSPFMLPHLAVDGRLVTGQNPSSTVAVANELVRQLGKEPASIPAFLDDKTLNLIAGLLKGDETSRLKAKNNLFEYQIPLVGMYGYYKVKVAKNDKELAQALELMALAQPTLNNAHLGVEMASVQIKLGRNSDAKTTLESVLESKPGFQPALDMLKTI